MQKLCLNSQSLYLICINLASPFFLSSLSRSLRVFVAEQFGHTNKGNTSKRIDKSTNLNPAGNIDSFG